jgi:hypothetical protein
MEKSKFMAMQLRPESRPGWDNEAEESYSIPAGRDEMYWVIVPTILQDAKRIEYSDADEDHPEGVIEATLADGKWAKIEGVPWGDSQEEAWAEFGEYEEGDIYISIKEPFPRFY